MDATTDQPAAGPEVEDAYQAHVRSLHERMDAEPVERKLQMGLSENASAYILDVFKLVRPTTEDAKAAHKEVVDEMTRAYQVYVAEGDPRNVAA